MTDTPRDVAYHCLPTTPSSVGRAARGVTWAAIFALVMRDLAGRPHLFRAPLLLDLAFGLVNLVVFLFISRVLSVPAGDGFEHSASYFDFVAVGITFMLVLQAASTQLTARINKEQHSGTLEMLAAQPVPVWAFAVGLAAYPFLFALLRAGVYLAVLSMVLGLHVAHASWLGVVVILAAGGSAMMGIGIALMAFSIAVGHGDAVARVLVVGLSFVSGTYFPVTALPTVAQHAAAALPTRIALDGLRVAVAGGDWDGAALALLATTAVLLPMSVWLFGRAVGIAIRRGSLTRG
jgi:ABC-2 type transport system permease protein